MTVSSLRPVSSADDRTAGQDGNILQHGLAAITKARGFDSQHVQHAAQFVQDERSQSFAIDIFSDDDEFALADLNEFFEDGNDILRSRNLLLIDQNIRRR